MDRETLIVIGVALGVAVGLAIPAWLALLAARRLQAAAQRRLDAILAEPGAPACGPEVEVLTFAYYGFVATLTTVRIERRLPVARAHELLDRIHGFNLCWGWFAAGGLFVPIASTLRRWRERRRIRRQLDRIADAGR